MKIVSNSNLSSEASNIQSNNDNILNSINDISNAIEELSNYWSGEDANSFIDKLNSEIIPKLYKSYDDLSEYATYMGKVDSIFEAIDENYNKKIDV